MPLTTIQSSKLRLDIVPEAGASVASLAARAGGDWVSILRPTSAEAVAKGNSSLFSSFVLAPWSNRIRDACFEFAGRSVQLRPNTADGHAIHGDVRKRPWTLVGRSAVRLELHFDSRDFADVNFPFPFTVDLDYAIDDATLATSVRLRNAGTQAMPAGLGFHPYFQRALLDPSDDAALQMTTTGVYPALLPTTAARALDAAHDFTRMRPLGKATFDHCFSGWDGNALIRWPKSGIDVAIEATEPFRHVVLYVPPDEPFFAVEPVSHANDGFNLAARGVGDAGMRVLEPGASLAGSFRIEIRT